MEHANRTVQQAIITIIQSVYLVCMAVLSAWTAQFAVIATKDIYSKECALIIALLDGLPIQTQHFQSVRNVLKIVLNVQHYQLNAHFAPQAIFFISIIALLIAR